MLYSSERLAEDLKGLEEKFSGVLNKLEINRDKEGVSSMPKQLTRIVERWIHSRILRGLEGFVSREKVETLKQILDEYSDLLEYCDTKDPKELIIDTFTFKKGLTGIEPVGKDAERINSFIQQLRKFFFASYSADEIFISRFKNLPVFAETNKEFLTKPDVAGTSYGYSAGDILLYCKEKGLLNLIKL
ncbi:hypothetical protein LCGC14_0691900 [marine sediment metagenome]|uniref:Uncharacterized protein n=1 Tax=marine sediment metagenome TaxID=412755 RepID=A0A0F9R5J1_9ZZZZ|nr:hypothetical protein [bacterium]